MAPLLSGIFRCSICDKFVSLQDCKIDEDGHAVHENCYTLLTLERSRRGQFKDVLVEQDRRKR
jgi:hypothetical protein